MVKRLRRLRMRAFTRALVQENTLTPSDFIYPVFITAGQTTPIAGMPGCFRYALKDLLPLLAKWHQGGLSAIALFPYIDPSKKSLNGEEAWHPEGLIPQAIQTIHAHLPELGIIADVALDPYTTHGQDGIINAHGDILNDETVEALTKQALVCAQAGADVVAPSDMMDGRVGAIRQALEKQGLAYTSILSYSAKYASSFYGPFRAAIGSAQSQKPVDKRTYQLNPANQREALQHIQRDIEEGADMVMVKPAMPYLDVIQLVKSTHNLPVVAYQVSGEYAMLEQAVTSQLLQPGVIEESLYGIKRAGADIIISYFVPWYFEYRGWI